MATLVLRITPADPSPGWNGRWYVDNQPVGDPIAVTDSGVKRMTDLARNFLQLFEQHGPGDLAVRPFVEPEALRALGRVLHETWFAPAWPVIRPRLGTGAHALTVRSVDSNVLNLPWELVELTPDMPLGCDAAWALGRSPVDEDRVDDAPARPGPLRILFLAAAPLDQGQLDYEREEDAILRATARLQDVSLHFAELGRYDELRDLVAECRPHVVHLSGHGVVKDGMGWFAFEDERGKTDLRGADEIVADVFRGGHHGVRCVFFNGCQTSQAATAGLCQSLAAAGAPLALGWSASVADDRATDFAERFYRELVRGVPVPAAVAHAREAIRVKGRVRNESAHLQDATFALPQVYAPTAAAVLFDKLLPPEKLDGPRTRYVLLGDGIKGLAEGFVGRRREIQRLVPALRDGETTFAVLTGLGGAGKSTLATRAVNRLETTGFRRVPVRVENDARGPAETGRAFLTRLSGAIGEAFLKAERNDLYARVTDEKIPHDQRLRLAVSGLNEIRAAIVIDNFEDVLDLETRQIVDPGLAAFYRHLATDLTEGSRVVVTCRYLPAQTPTEQQVTVAHLPLPEFGESEFRKFLRRDDKVEARIAQGKLRPDLLHQIYAAFGGTPGFLVNVRTLLQTVDPDALRDDLEGVSPGALSEARDAYYQRIITARLYDVLPPAARALVSRLAVSELPLPADGVARIVEPTDTSLDASLAAGVNFGLLRPWLSAPDRLPEAEARAIDRQLAAFWKESFEARRLEELRVPHDVALRSCHSHSRRSSQAAIFRWATAALGRLLMQRTEWFAARDLLRMIPDQDHDMMSLHVLADAEISLSEWKAARLLLVRALRTPTDRQVEAAVWHNLATIELREGDYASATEKFGHALAILQAIDDRAGEAAVLHQLASLDLREKEYASAREKLGRVLAMCQSIGNRWSEAIAWHNLASIDQEEGNLASAREKFGRSLEIKQSINDRLGEAATLQNLALIDLIQEDYSSAREKFGRSLEIKQSINDRLGEAVTFAHLGMMAYHYGKDHEGARLLAIGYGIAQAIGHASKMEIQRMLHGVCSTLGYDQNQYNALPKEAFEEYWYDRGWALIERAFAGTVAGDVAAPEP